MILPGRILPKRDPSLGPLQQAYFDIVSEYLEEYEWEEAKKEIKTMNAVELRRAIEASKGI